MQQVDQVAQLERLLGLVRTNTRDDAPGLSHAPVDEYFDAARYDREVRLLFRRYPVVVAFSAQRRKPGDFVTHNDSASRFWSTRGTDGVLRAFLNVCRHRSAAVETKACGEGKRAFVCPYHGWSYDLTGRLLGITDGAAFGDVDRAAHGLRSLAVAEKYGLVWVVPTAARGRPGRRARHRCLSRPGERRARELGHDGLGGARLGADPLAAELEAGWSTPSSSSTTSATPTPAASMRRSSTTS